MMGFFCTNVYTAESIKTPETNTCRRSKAREKVCAGFTIGYCFTSAACQWPRAGERVFLKGCYVRVCASCEVRRL